MTGTGFLAYIKEFHFVSVMLRLLAAMGAGAVIGYGRSKKNRDVGLRTFILISIGSALTVVMAIYEYTMLTGQWAPIVEIVGLKYDGARYAAQVMSGIGFLGAGTILSDSHLQVHGLTSAAGLFAAAGMGIAAGAGFFELVLITAVMIIVVMEIMYPLERNFKRRRRNITVFVQFETIEDIARITDAITERHAAVHEIDIERTRKEDDKWPAAVISLRMARGQASHSEMLSTIAGLPCVLSIQELIS